MSKISSGSLTVVDVKGGSDGINTATIYLYQRATTAPSKPSTNLTYTFATAKLTGGLGSWTQDIGTLTGNDPIWVIAAVASSNGTTDVIESTEWSEPIKMAQDGQSGEPGQPGAKGLNQATIFIYKRDDTATKPNSVTYTFATGSFTVPTGWSTSIPQSNGKPCWVCSAVAIGSDDTAQLNWTNPSVMVEDGSDGVSPVVTSTDNGVQIYDPINDVTYTIINGADGTSYYTHILYSSKEVPTSANDVSNSPENKDYVGILTTNTSAVPAWNDSRWIWKKYIGEDGQPGTQGDPGPQGVSVTGTRELYYLKTNSASVPSITSTSQIDSVSKKNGWTSVVPTYTGSGTYYTCIETSLSTGGPVWSAPVENKGLTNANENAQGALSISRATQQHFWFVSENTGSGASLIEAGAYITDTPIDTFKNGKSGGYLLARSDGIILGKGTNRYMELSGSELKFYKAGTTDSTASTASNVAAKLSSTGLEIANGSITLGDYFSVTNEGVLTAESGTIGGWSFTDNALYYSNATPGYSTSNLVISKNSAVNANAIAGSETNKHWFLAAGRNFGVDTDGVLYASGANIQGQVTITAGSNVYTKDEVDDAVGDVATEFNTFKTTTYATDLQQTNEAISLRATKTEAQGYADTAESNAKNDTTEKLKSYYTKTETDSQITQTANSITSTVSSTYETKTDASAKLTEAKGDATTKANQALTDAKADTTEKLKSYSTTTQMNSAIEQKANSIALSVSEEKIAELISTKEVSGSIVHVEDASEYPALDCKISLEPIQDLNGYDAPWVGGAGKNLIDDSIKFIRNTNLYIGNENTYTIPLKSGTYTFSAQFANGVHYGASIREQNDTANTSLWSATSSTTEKTITLQNDGLYRVWMYAQSEETVSETGVVHAQLELGSTATAYEPYSNICPISGWTEVETIVSPTTSAEDGTTYTTSLGRTVYGGTLDVVSGKLTVDRAYALLNDASKWAVPSGSTVDYRYNETFTRKFYSDSFTGLICSIAQVRSGSGVSYTARWTGAGAGFFGIVDRDGLTSLDEIKQLASNNEIAICYDIEPQTYQLTPQQVELLAGTNNVWSDSGDTYLKYITMNSDMLSLMDKSNADLSRAKAEIKVTTDGISSEVAKKVGDSEIISKINQSAETVQIEAEKIEFNGSVVFNAIKSQTDAAYDTKGSASEASKIATSYITDIDSKNGITIKAINGETSGSDADKQNYIKLNANGLDIYKGGDSVAFYGDTARIGKVSSDKIEITPTAFSASNSSGVEGFRVELNAPGVEGWTPATQDKTNVSSVNSGTITYSGIPSGSQLMTSGDASIYFLGTTGTFNATTTGDLIYGWGPLYNRTGIYINLRSQTFTYGTSKTITDTMTARFNNNITQSYTVTLQYNGSNKITITVIPPSGDSTDMIYFPSMYYYGRVERSTAVTAGSRSGATGAFSIAMGEGLIASEPYSVAFGSYNDANETYRGNKILFSLGNGTANDVRSNAFCVDAIGDIYVGLNYTPDVIQGESIDKYILQDLANLGWDGSDDSTNIDVIVHFYNY